MQEKNIHQEAQPEKHHIDFDQDGFILDPNSWNKQMARTIAERDEIGPLGQDHWSVIYYLREHHLTYGSLPPMAQVCRTAHLGQYAVHWLFGGCRNAWRIAGLPNPGGEALTYMS